MDINAPDLAGPLARTRSRRPVSRGESQEDGVIIILSLHRVPPSSPEGWDIMRDFYLFIFVEHEMNEWMNEWNPSESILKDASYMIHQKVHAVPKAFFSCSPKNRQTRCCHLTEII